MNKILLLIVLGLLFFFFELFLPGGVLGTLGVLALIGASYLGYETYGPLAGSAIFLGSTFLAFTAFFIEIKLLKKTKYGRRFFVNTQIDAKSQITRGSEALIGKTGKTETALSPTGIISIEGTQYEAHSQDGFILSQTPVTVTGYDNFQILVKKQQ